MEQTRTVVSSALARSLCGMANKTYNLISRENQIHIFIDGSLCSRRRLISFFMFVKQINVSLPFNKTNSVAYHHVIKWYVTI